jgi:hypothetical protein
LRLVYCLKYKMKSLEITSKEISSLDEMDLLFEGYCLNNGISLDMTKSKEYNAYVDRETALSYQWFIKGIFRAIGIDYLKKLV